METKRFELENGQWVEFYVELKHKTAKAVQDFARVYLTFPSGKSTANVSQDTEGKLKIDGGAKNLKIDLAKMDNTKEQEIYILGQAKEWSFGKVNASVLGDLSEKEFDELKDIVLSYYKLRPLPESAGES